MDNYYKVQRMTPNDVDQPIALALAKLWCSVNDHPGETVLGISNWMLDSWGNPHGRYGSELSISIIKDMDRYLALAVGHSRLIRVGNKEILVLGLGGVSVAEDCQKRGMGRAVVEDQFSRMNNSNLECSLFGSAPDAVGFYKNLGATCIDRPLVNSQGLLDHKEKAFGDDIPMCFPGNYPWPDGQIDIMGPKY